MRVQLANIAKSHGAQVVLDDVTLTIGPLARIGLVGPNGVGKSTLLRILAGVDEPDRGTVARSPETLTIGYLEQDRRSVGDESVLGALARRTGVLAAEWELEASAAALARGERADERYSRALDAFVALGGGDFEPRARAVCADLGLEVDLDRDRAALSGGESARVELAGILLSRFDVLLLDEPTNDLDHDGLARLESFLGTYRGALVPRVARPRAARPHRRADRGDRAAVASASRVGRRVERLRRCARHGAESRSRPSTSRPGLAGGS